MKRKLLVIAMLLVLPSLSVNAAGLSSPRAVAMGGANIGLAKGIDASLYNPANIGLSGYKENALCLVGAGVDVINNSFTLSDYNSYTGAVLSDNDKSVILGKIPAEGLKISAEAEGGAMSLSMGSFVLSINGVAATEVNLGKDALELFLEGNNFNDSFSLNGMYSDAIAYGSVGLSYGASVYKLGTRQLALGATFRYIKGIAYEEVTEIHGGVVTMITGFSGEGTMTARTATGGSGYAVDAGAALKLSDSYTAGISFSNILSNITWNNATEEHGYHFQFDTLTLELIQGDSIVVSDEYSRDIPAFKSSLPAIMRIGFAKTAGKLLWAVDWTQGFKLTAGSSTKPRLSAGLEYRPLGLLPLRAGYSLGGGKGSIISGGLGLDLSIFYMDIALANNSNLNFGSAKGIHCAVALGFKF